MISTLTSDPDESDRAIEAVNVDIDRKGHIEARPGYAAVDIAAPPNPTIHYNGRDWRVEGEYLYAASPLGDDTDDALNWLYVGPRPRILGAVDGGLWVAIDHALLFLRGGQYPPALEQVLPCRVFSLQLAVRPDSPGGVVLTAAGAYALGQGGEAERLDDEAYLIPPDLGDVNGIVVVHPTYQKIIFTEA